MADLDGPLEENVLGSKIIKFQVYQIVKTCRSCQLIYISDRIRILCPYCGSFYDPKAEEDFGLRGNEDKNEYISRTSIVSYKIISN